MSNEEHDFRVTCLVDNKAGLSTSCWAEHGISFLIETTDAKVLFDTGQSGEVLVHNLAVLGRDLDGLSCVVLSHGHYDHTGGLGHVLANSTGVEILAHPNLFDERISRAREKVDRVIGMPFPRDKLESMSRLRLCSEPVEVVPGVMTTGQIKRGFGPEPQDERLLVRQDGELVLDRCQDDQSLVLNTQQGLVVLLGCCHAGLINTLEHICQTYSTNLLAILGGTHLAAVDKRTQHEIVHTARDRYAVERVYVGHCTGPRGFLSFVQCFGDRAQSCAAGLTLTF